MPEEVLIDLHSPEETTDFGRRLGGMLYPGAVVALIGTLGAGKTHLVRAVAEGLGVRDSRVVSSPTFVLIQEYPGRVPIYHFDAYRLRSLDEFFDLGAHEYFESDGVCLVEWADRVTGALPNEHLAIRFEVTGERTRRLHITAVGERPSAIVTALAGSPGSAEGAPRT